MTRRARRAGEVTPGRGRGVESLTTLGAALSGVLDEPSSGLSAWARTAGPVVALLLAAQFVTGALLAFYYVPSAESAHATVAFIEKALPAGPWLRALHLHASQLLPLALLLHLAQGFARGAHRRKPAGWVASVLLLALVLANGATGYSLPWDARAFFSTRVAEGIAGGLPLAGPAARAWLAGGEALSTLTLSRFYAVHVLVVPALVLLAAVARFFIFSDAGASARTGEDGGRADEGARRDWAWAQAARAAVACGVVFLGLAIYAARSPAPFGPAAGDAPAGYLPRPGAQFLWLFQLLKYFPTTVASLVALILPTTLLCALAALPFLPTRAGRRPGWLPGLGVTTFALIFLLVGGLSAAAVWDDWHDPRVRAQLATQAKAEADFRRAPFAPKRAGGKGGAGGLSGRDAETPDDRRTAGEVAPPEAYTQNCARCHGQRGEGKSVYPPLVGVSRQPRRTNADIVAILNDPASYGLEKRMPSFRDKLTDEQKRVIAEWVSSLR